MRTRSFLRAGIIGCGNIGGRYDEKDTGGAVYTHAGIYRNVNGIELVCAADTDPERLEAFGKYWDIERLYNNPKDMLKKENIDILSVATPDETHECIIMEALKYNPPRIIFSEKPLAENADRARKVVAACEEKGVSLVVDYVRRWDENHQGIRKFIRSGKLGHIKTVVGYYVRGLSHNGCQMINLLSYLFGQVKEAQVIGEACKGSIVGDPSLSFRLKMSDGTEAVVLALDQVGYDFSIFELDIMAGKGRMRLLDGGERIELNEAETDDRFPNFKRLYPAVSKWESSTYGSAMVRAGEEMVSFLMGESTSLSNLGGEAVEDMKVVEGALSSARKNNTPVKITK